MALALVPEWGSSCLPGAQADHRDGMPSYATFSARTRTACSGPSAGTVSVLAVAHSTVTNGTEGMLVTVRCGGGGRAAARSTLLRQVNAVGTVTRLNNPQQLLASVDANGRSVTVIVGAGTSLSAAVGASETTGAAIAIVDRPSSATAARRCAAAAASTVACSSDCGCCASDCCHSGAGTLMILLVGMANVSPTAIYRDIIDDPKHAAWLVCGDDPDGFGSFVQRIPKATLVATTPSWCTPAVAFAGPTFTPSLALCDGLLAVAVVDTVASQSLLWALEPSELVSQPWPAVQWNDATTNRLRLPAGAATLVVLRVLACPSGAVSAAAAALYTASIVGNSPTTPLPPYGAAVHAFLDSTAPWTAFGVEGVDTWYAPAADSCDVLTTMLSDALWLLCDGCAPQILLVGNAYTAVGSDDPDATWTFAAPFPKEVIVPEGVLPQPFAVAISTTCAAACGAQTYCVDGALARCPAATVFATTAAFVRGLQPPAFVLLGDITFHLGVPAAAVQAPLLTLLLSCTARTRAQNVSMLSIPALQTLAQQCGTAVLDTACSPCTALVVPGRITLGDVSPASTCDTDAVLPGTLRFDAATATFQGYNGTTWVTLGPSP